MAIKTQDKEFIDILKSFFVDLHKPRIEFLFLMIQSITTVGTVNLVKVAAGIKTKIDSSSSYRRIQRFIHNIQFKSSQLVPFILRLSGIEGPYTLIMDRTNWQFGKAKINFLMLSVKKDGWCVPLIGTLLPKKGNSSEQERIDMIEKLITMIGKNKIYNLVADREFIGDKWFSYLNEQGIPYDIRLRENLKVWFKNKLVHVSKIFKRVPIDQMMTIPMPVIIGTTTVYLQGGRIINTKTNKQEYLILATYCQPNKSSKRYDERWYIENMFKDMKSNGFQMECTYITKLNRLDTLMSILSIVYIWMIKIGAWIKKTKPQLFKKTKHGRPAKSIFRAGIDDFTNAIINADHRRLRKYYKFLPCIYKPDPLLKNLLPGM